MKALYEGLNGYIGESYVRVYCWATSDTEARELIQKAFDENVNEQNETRAVNRKFSYSKRFGMRKLFTADAASFTTRPSDSGWELGSEDIEEWDVLR